MPNEITIPILPCGSIPDTLSFYVALGFEITYQQTRPNAYGCVKRGAIELHFFTLKDYIPANSYSSCVILVSDADALYAAFAAGLRSQYGKLLSVGIPRITRPNNHNAAGDRRFNVVDPGGNWIRFVQQVESQSAPKAPDTPVTRLSRSILAAELLVNSKGDFPAAGQLLDAALLRDEPEATPIERVRATVLRAEIAANSDDPALAKHLLAEVSGWALSDGEREALTDVLQKADELAQELL